MDTNDSAIKELARRLIAFEAARGEAAEAAEAAGGAAARVCERLRAPLSKLAGAAGFRSLMSRALAMAKAEFPSLDEARVLPDGAVEGLGGGGRARDIEVEAGALLVAQLLGLLVTFIGEALMLRLVRDAWPDAPAVGLDLGSGEGA